MAAPKTPPKTKRKAGQPDNGQMPKSVVQQQESALASGTGIDRTAQQNIGIYGGGIKGNEGKPGSLATVTGYSAGPGGTSGTRPIPDIPQLDPDKPDLTILGATGTSFFGGLIQNDEYNPELHWRDWVLKVEAMMRSDAQVRSVVGLTVDTLLGAQWKIEPGSEDAVDAEIASFVETAMFHELRYTTEAGVDVVQTWSDVLRHILLMLPYGFSPLEICYRTEDDGEGGQWVKWARWLPLLPRTVYRWWVGADTELEGIQTWAYKDYTYVFTNIPRSKILLFSHDMQGQNYEGLSLLRPCFPYWWYKQNFLKITAIEIERNGIAVPWFRLGQNATQADANAALKQAQNMRANEQMGVITPFDWEVSYLGAREKYAAQTMPMIEYCDVMIARAFYEQWINLGSTETGAYNLDASQKRTWLTALQARAQYICDVINNEAIRKLVDYNFADVAVYPKLTCSKLVAQDITTLADALTNLGTYVPPSPVINDFIADVLGLPKPPTNAIEATNPTAPDGSQGGGTDNGAPGGGGDQQPQQDAGQPVASGGAGMEEPEGNPDGSGGGGASATMSEIALLAETLRAVYAGDAVDRALLFAGHEPGYDSQPHVDHGHWGPGQGSDSGGGGGGRGRGGAKAAAAPKSGRGGGGGGGSGGKSAGAKAKTEKAPKAAKEPKAKSAGPKAEPAANGGAASKAAKAPAESIHERAARLQREGNLPREVQAGERLKPQEGFKPESPGKLNINPFKAPDVQGLIRIYGEHGLGRALSDSDHATLREVAHENGVQAGRTKAETISRITAAATEGRYSADFGAHAATAKGGAAKAGAKTAEEKAAARKTATIARLKSEIADLHEKNVRDLQNPLGAHDNSLQRTHDINTRLARLARMGAIQNLPPISEHGMPSRDNVYARQRIVEGIHSEVRAGQATIAKGAASAGTRTSGTAAKGGAGKAGMAPGESIHERARQWQAAHPDAPREVQPGERLKPQEGFKPESPGKLNINPFKAPDVHQLVRIYGEHGLGRALSDSDHATLREVARENEVQPSRSHAETVSRIVAKVTTHGSDIHYSADFGAHASAGAAKGAASAGTRTSGTTGTRAARGGGGAKAGGGKAGKMSYEEFKARLERSLAAQEAGARAGNIGVAAAAHGANAGALLSGHRQFAARWRKENGYS